MAGGGAKGEGEGHPVVLCCRIFSSWGKAERQDVQIQKLEPAVEAAMQRGPLPSPFTRSADEIGTIGVMASSCHRPSPGEEELFPFTSSYCFSFHQFTAE